MGGGNSHDTSISKPYYPSEYGTAGREPSKEEVAFENKNNKGVADMMNNQYRNENPILALTDDAIQTTGTLLKVAIGISIGYLAVEGYKAYKTK